MDKPRVALFALWPWQGSFQVVQREQRTHGLLPQIRWANCGCVLSHMPKHFEYPTPMVSDDLKAPKPINVQKFHGLENQSSSLFHIIPIHVGSFWGGVSPVRNGAFSRMELKHMFHALQVPLGPELNTSRPRRKPTGSWPGHVGHGGSNTQLTLLWIHWSIGTPIFDPRKLEEFRKNQLRVPESKLSCSALFWDISSKML